MGWMTALFATGPARKALGLLLAVTTIALFLLNLRRAGERAGRLAERLSTSERTHEIQRQMLEAATPPVSGKLSAALFFSNFQVGGIGQ